MSVREQTQCPACGSGRVSDVLTIDRIPVFCNVLHDTAESAHNAAMGTMDLVACSTCGLLFNAAFNPDLVTYAAGYENSLHFSPSFQRYADALARRLVDTYQIDGGHIVEIGSGSGEFLQQICEMSDSKGTGFDPSFDPTTSVAPTSERVTVVAEPFTGGAVDRADLVLARHVLEHVADPPGLLRDLRRGSTSVAGDPPVTYLEVPDATYMLQHTAVWDLIYEHYTYWSKGALTRALSDAGFRVLADGRAFGDQFLWVDAVPADDPPAEDATGESLSAVAGTFANRFTTEVAHWRARIDELSRDHTVVIWGAGSKGVTFANIVGVDPSVSRMVDINPRKRDRYVPGTGHGVVGPEELHDVAPVHVLLMNGMYEEEVSRTAADIGLGAAVEVV